jgi:chromosome segregation ATPase
MLRLTLTIKGHERGVAQQALADAVLGAHVAESEVEITERMFTGAKADRGIAVKRMMDDADDIRRTQLEASLTKTAMLVLMQDAAEIQGKLDRAILALEDVRIDVRRKESVIDLMRREQRMRLRTLARINAENRGIYEETQTVRYEANHFKDAIRELDRSCLELHMKREGINAAIEALTEKGDKLEHKLQLKIAENLRLGHEVVTQCHVDDEGVRSIAQLQYVVTGIRGSCTAMVEEVHRQRAKIRTLIEEVRVLQSERMTRNHHFQILVENVEHFEGDLDICLDKKTGLIAKTRRCHRLGKQVGKLEKAVSMTHSYLAALQTEAEVPRNVHPWTMMQDTNPALWDLLSMKISLVNAIGDRLFRADRLAASRATIGNRIEGMKDRIHKIPCTGFSDQIAIATEALRERTRLIREVEHALQCAKPKAEGERRHVRSIRSLIQDKRVENDDGKAIVDKLRQMVSEKEPQSEKLQVRPPASNPANRAPGRFVGGGFLVGDLHPPIPALDLGAVEVKKTKQRPKTSRNQAVLVPGSGRRPVFAHWGNRPNSSRVVRD